MLENAIIPPAAASDRIITTGSMMRTKVTRPQMRAVRLQQNAHFPENLDLPYVQTENHSMIDHIHTG